ncbi:MULTISPECIES: Uma2 family endonuclease [unclassified Coleofasciculus]|uniref:Uma2 family endonuclease n=1 Tax=Cyanophyceae TaxID=3028117 RepID=UPI00168945B4|nr:MULTISPECIES: Uma2 family endonuclease [unclassified Coleofasciculus]MBD1878890.1 Uma2 family endonuclease [Coleofasciculus sp. FACHB-T130]MBD2539811.1 Uma2 family endonuclease [Coleofasciculus sp. FACHB-SPT36]
MTISKNFYISKEDYLEGERVSPIKHEYRRGQVYAMVGAKKPHIIIAGNLVTLFNNHLEHAPCIVLSSDIKVRLESADCYYYPDVAVTCDERDTNSTDDFILYPILVIEVLSPSTAAFDRGEKFADYQTSPSLREYVLIHQSQMSVECFRLSDSGNWVSQIYRQGDEVYFASIDFRCDIASIYRKVPGLQNADA